MPRKTKILLFLLIFISVNFFFSFFTTSLIMISLKKTNFKQASKIASFSLPVAKLQNLITLKSLPPLRLQEAGLKTIISGSQLASHTQQLAIDFHQGKTLDFNQIQPCLNQLEKDITELNQATQSCWLLKNLAADNLQQLDQGLTVLKSFNLALKQKPNQKYIIWLQNNDELRASGGFLGSVAVIELKNYQLAPFTFYDIYDLAGQVEHPLPAPEPVKKYLSGGQGMNLTDCNWSANFPTNAEKFLQLLQQTDLQTANGIIAINLDLLEKILQITGPILVPDFQQHLTADNFAQLAREQRSDFFPGDKQKKMFLEQAFSYLMIKLGQLNQAQQIALGKLIYDQLNSGEILLYSSTNQIQQNLQKLGWAGVLQPPADNNWLYLVSSNVGINKANKNVSLKYDLTAKKNNLATLKLTFHNDNRPLNPEEKQAIQDNPHLQSANHLGYVNFQRILTQADNKVTQVKCDGENIELEQNQVLQLDNGMPVREVGFLVLVPEKTKKTCEIEIKAQNSQKWEVQTQPGIILSN